VSGTYQFSWKTLTITGKLAETELMVDNVVKDTLHNSLDARTISGTKVVLGRVTKGDHVWIQTVIRMVLNISLLLMLAKSHLLECCYMNCKCLIDGNI
jgi:hypothetical protein